MCSNRGKVKREEQILPFSDNKTGEICLADFLISSEDMQCIIYIFFKRQQKPLGELPNIIRLFFYNSSFIRSLMSSTTATLCSVHSLLRLSPRRSFYTSLQLPCAMANYLYETSLQGIMVVVFIILDWILVLMNIQLP